MKAARLTERRKPLEVTDLPDPAPGPGEEQASDVLAAMDAYETLGFSVITGF